MQRIERLGALAALGLLVLLCARGAFGMRVEAEAAEIGPGTNFCRVLHQLAPGEELVLRPGEYQGPCTIRRGGAPGSPLVLRGQDPARPPRIVYAGNASNVINVQASHVVIRGLEFGPSQPGVDAVRVYPADDVTVEDCRFTGLGGIAVVANHGNVAGLVVRRNEIRGSQATAMYFGCHDGATCRVSSLVVEGNYIEGVTAPDPQIGYGLEVKLNSTATIRDNVVLDTKGPGIMVYGARALLDRSVVERNFVAGSRHSSGIVVGGGPAIVRNNIAVKSAEAGIGLEDYGHRGLLRGIVIAHNTLYDNAAGGIVVPTGARDITIVNNAAAAPPGRPPFPPSLGSVVSRGNVDCSRIPCFMDPGAWDFSPLVLGPGVPYAAPWMPTHDYLGRLRSAMPVVGALEQVAPPIKPGPKAAGP